jgi:hypothetical protein
MGMSGEIWNEVAVAYSKILSYKLLGDTKWKHRKLQSVQPVT